MRAVLSRRRVVPGSCILPRPFAARSARCGSCARSLPSWANEPRSLPPLQLVQEPACDPLQPCGICMWRRSVEGEGLGELQWGQPGLSVSGFWGPFLEELDALRFLSPQPPRQRPGGVKGGTGQATPLY